MSFVHKPDTVASDSWEQGRTRLDVKQSRDENVFNLRESSPCVHVLRRGVVQIVRLCGKNTVRCDSRVLLVKNEKVVG